MPSTTLEARYTASARSQKLDEAYNKNDAAAVAALFTEDAVLVAPDGRFSGRQDIEKRYADIFQRCQTQITLRLTTGVASPDVRVLLYVRA
jgi:uncharacterized protein (TIGR02246 family)